MSDSNVRAYWDEQAGTFDDEVDHGLRDPAARRAWGDLLAELMPPAPARVADLGSGTGSLSVLLAERGYDVSGIDLAPAMVAQATAKAARHGVTARFAVGDAAGGGLAAHELEGLLAPLVATLAIRPLTDEALWGRRTDDERYAVVARA